MKLVTGYTKIVLINDWEKGIYRKNGHIALDCACVSEEAGGILSAKTLDMMSAGKLIEKAEQNLTTRKEKTKI